MGPHLASTLEDAERGIFHLEQSHLLIGGMSRWLCLNDDFTLIDDKKSMADGTKLPDNSQI
jgi:hypothetical protein